MVAMRRLLKFLHTIGAIGLMGAMACILVMSANLPDPETQLAEYAAVREVMRAVSQMVLTPSIGLTIVAGLFSMAATPAFHSAGWALAKLATGVIMFEWSLIAIDGPMRREAAMSAEAVTGASTAALGADGQSITLSIWLLLLIAALNVGLGVWRPRFRRAGARGVVPAAD